MNKMTKWALPLSLLMMVGVHSGATEASAKTITSETAKQTSMSNCDWQNINIFNWVKLNTNSQYSTPVKTLTKPQFYKFVNMYTGYNNGNFTINYKTPNTVANKVTTNTTSSNNATANTTTNKVTTNTASKNNATANTTTNKVTTNTASNNNATANTTTNKVTTNTASNNNATANTATNKVTTNTTASSTPATNTTANKNTSTTAGSTNSATSSASQFEQQVVTLTNAERAKQGLPALQIDTKLMSSAEAKSQDMSKNNYFDHTSPTLGTPFEQMKALGISYKSAGENIAMGQKTPAEVVKAWMDSPGHRANILNSSYTHIGVGYASNGNYWTQQFIQK